MFQLRRSLSFSVPNDVEILASCSGFIAAACKTLTVKHVMRPNKPQYPLVSGAREPDLGAGRRAKSTLCLWTAEQIKSRSDCAVCRAGGSWVPYFCQKEGSYLLKGGFLLVKLPYAACCSTRSWSSAASSRRVVAGGRAAVDRAGITVDRPGTYSGGRGGLEAAHVHTPSVDSAVIQRSCTGAKLRCRARRFRHRLTPDITLTGFSGRALAGPGGWRSWFVEPYESIVVENI